MILLLKMTIRYENIISLYREKTYSKDKKQSHAAFLMNGKKLVSVGYNQFGRYSFGGSRVSSLHAEMDCIRQIKGI